MWARLHDVIACSPLHRKSSHGQLPSNFRLASLEHGILNVLPGIYPRHSDLHSKLEIFPKVESRSIQNFFSFRPLFLFSPRPSSIGQTQVQKKSTCSIRSGGSRDSPGSWIVSRRGKTSRGAKSAKRRKQTARPQGDVKSPEWRDGIQAILLRDFFESNQDKGSGRVNSEHWALNLCVQNLAGAIKQINDQDDNAAARVLIWSFNTAKIFLGCCASPTATAHNIHQ